MILARNFRPGDYHLSDTQIPSTASGFYDGDKLLCLPFSRLLRADAIVIEATNTGVNARAGLYGAGCDGRSGDLIEDCGEVAITAAGDIIFPFTAPRFEDRPLTLAVMFDGTNAFRLANMSSTRGGYQGGYSTLNTSNLSNYASGFEMTRAYADGLPGSLRVDNVLGISAVPALALRSA